MSFLSRKVKVGFAAIATGCWAGCTTGPQPREARLVRELFTAANDRAIGTVIGGTGLFESEGARQSRFEEFLYGPQETSFRPLRTPQGLATDGHLLWVCDQGYPDVLAINPESSTYRSATARAHRPATPVAVAIDDSLNVYVADATRRSVLMFNTNGTFVRELVQPTPFEPTALTVRDGVLYVADRASRQIVRYELSTQSWQSPIAPGVDQPALAVPTGLAFGADGILYVTDALLGCVHRMEPSGTWIEPLGSRGRADGQLVRPIGICTTPGGFVVVADSARQALIVYGSDGGHIIDVHPKESEIATWTLPMGLACLPGPPSIPELPGERASESGDWIVVSDMLGQYGLSLVHVKSQATLDGDP